MAMAAGWTSQAGGMYGAKEEGLVLAEALERGLDLPQLSIHRKGVVMG